MTTTVKEILKKLPACDDARAWAGDRSLVDVWTTCERGDWLLWLATRAGVDRRLVVRAAAACARAAVACAHTALPYTTDPRVAACLEVTDAWTRGEATLDEVRTAGAAAAHAAADAAPHYATYATHAADTTTHAAAAPHYATAQKIAADIVRGLISVAVVAAALSEDK